MSEVADTIPLLALKPIHERCPITKATTFWGSLSYLLESGSPGIPCNVKVTRKRWQAEILETSFEGDDVFSFFEPLTRAEDRTLKTVTKPQDEDASFGLSEPPFGIITVAEFDVMTLISDFQDAIGKGHRALPRF